MFDTLFWAFYWIDVLSSVDDAALLGGVVGAVATVIYVVVSDGNEGAPEMKTIKRGLAVVGTPVLLLCLAINMIPTKDTMYMMLATRVTDQAVSSEMGQKLLRALNAKMDTYLKELEGR